ncbi:type I polyketide synthase [Micromonospora nigra]|nr:type I polyketide synthase [Micromonospora nigra]
MDRRIAVIGMAVRLPGAEDAVDLSWMLRNDSVEVDEVPAGRWARGLYLGDGDHQGTHHRGGFLQDPFSFDHEAFGLSADEAVLLDPQQRMMLEVGARALEDAGYLARDRRQDIGVFVGARMNSYGFDHGRGLTPTPPTDTDRPTPAALWGRSQNFIAAWLSDRFDLSGPSLVVDTACSSSLTAVWLACQSLAAGACSTAVVGAVDLLIDPLTFVLLSRNGALSPEGLCKTFDERANGYVPGEGAAALVLKPMAAAVADGDLILGAITEAVVNNDGRTMGVTTPSLDAQIELMTKAYDRVDPGTVQYVEAHGTGTAIGDPIEVRALTEVFAQRGVVPGSVALGSVKRRIGHLHSAAGLAGLAKIITCLREGLLPGTPVEAPNPRLKLDRSPFYLPADARAWPAAPVRRAAVSGFGFGGTNGHVVAEAVPVAADPTGPAELVPQVLPLSADSPDGLRELVAQWVEFLPSAADRLGDVCATARLARPHRAARIAVAGHDADALVTALRARLLRAAPADATRSRPVPAAIRPVDAPRPPAWLLAVDRSTPAVREIVTRFEDAVGCQLVDFSGRLVGICSGIALTVALRERGVPETAVRLPEAWAPLLDFAYGRVPLEQALAAVVGADEGAPAEDLAGAVDVCDRLAGVTDVPAVAGVLASIVAELHESGQDIDWSRFQGDVAWTKQLLPVAQLRGTSLDLREPMRSPEPGGPVMLDSDDGAAGYVFSRLFGPGEVPIAQHSVYRTAMLPGVGWFDFLRRGVEARGDRFHGVRDLLFHRPLIPDGARRVVCRVDGDALFTVEDTDGAFVTGRFIRDAEPAPAPVPVTALLETCSRIHSGSGVYRWLRRIGYHHGRYYRNISWVASLAGGGTLARIEGGRQRAMNPADVSLFPGLLDSVTIAAIDPDNPVFGTDDASAFIPLSVDRVGVFGSLDDAAFVRTTVAFWNEEACRVTQVVTDASGNVLFVFGDISSKRVPARAFEGKRTVEVQSSAGPDLPAVPVPPVDRVVPPADLVVPPADRVVPAADLMVPAVDRAVPPAVTADAPPSRTGEAAAPADRPAPAARTAPAVPVLTWFLAEAGISDDHADTEFLSAGLDSISLVGLSDRLSREHGLSLYPTVFFEYPTPRSFADHLAREEPEFVATLTWPSGSPAGEAAEAAATVSPARSADPEAPPGSAATADPVTPPEPAGPTRPAGAATENGGPVTTRTGGREPGPEVARTDAPVATATADAPNPESSPRDIAIVGAAVRVPTAGSLDEFWSLLMEGRDTVGPVPAQRWSQPDHDGTQASFLEQVDQFDPAPFRISAREAPLIDPQARIVYETIWQALEDAGRLGDRGAGSRTGLWIAYSHDHYHEERARHGVSSGRGLGLEAMIPNRLSHLMDWQGPSLVVNTLCSSSLVALHSAVQHLRSGDIDTAVIGGVHAAISPEYFQSMRDLRALSPRHRCRAFDASADGFVPGEGAVAVVLRRSADAVRDGDRVRAVVKGVAVNHGGRTTRYSAPSPKGQAEVVGAALRDAGVDPVGIQMVEAHGTGTGLGDPIEVEGLSRAWRVFTDRVQFCGIGSLKSNVGHLEPAAGLAGVVKVVLALENGVIPPTLHVVRPNDHIRFEESPFFVVDRPVLWPRGGRVRRGAVSAFGMGGVNAHVVVEEAPVVGRAPVVGQDSFVVRVSAASEDAVRVLAGAYADRLVGVSGAQVGDVAFTANVGRAVHRFRVAVAGADGDELAAGLRRVASGDRPIGRLAGRGPVTGFLFTGQGSQYPGMGAGLYAAEPVFREAIDECAGLLGSLDGWSLPGLLCDAPAQVLGQTGFAQVAIVAVQVGLVRLLGSWGVGPQVVAGHSVGELTAAWAAGVCDLPELMRLTRARAQAMQAQPSGGAMAVVNADVDVVHRLLVEHPGVEVAAYNGPSNVTVAGGVEAVDGFCRAVGRGQRLTVSHAFHSEAMSAAVPVFAEAVAGGVLRAPGMPFASTITGGWHTGESVTDPRVWAEGIRRPVRYAEAVRLVREGGAEVFWEIGPHPVLVPISRQVLPEAGLTWLHTLRRGHTDQRQLHDNLVDYYNQGHTDLTWPALHHQRGHRTTTIPTYPFERERFWISPEPTGVDPVPAPAAQETGPPAHQFHHRPASHPGMLLKKGRV